MNRNTVLLGSFRDVPIESGKVDQDDRVHRSGSENVFGLVGKAKEFAELWQDFHNSDDGVACQVQVNAATGRQHGRAAKTAADDSLVVSHRQTAGIRQLTNQSSGVLVTAGFPDGKKNGLGHV